MRIKSSEEREERRSFGPIVRVRFEGGFVLLAPDQRRFKGIV